MGTGEVRYALGATCLHQAACTTAPSTAPAAAAPVLQAPLGQGLPATTVPSAKLPVRRIPPTTRPYASVASALESMPVVMDATH